MHIGVYYLYCYLDLVSKTVIKFKNCKWHISISMINFNVKSHVIITSKDIIKGFGCCYPKAEEENGRDSRQPL